MTADGDAPPDDGRERWIAFGKQLQASPAENKVNRRQIAIYANELSMLLTDLMKVSPSLLQHTILAYLIAAEAGYERDRYSISAIANLTNQSIQHVRNNAEALEAGDYLTIAQEDRCSVLVPKREMVELIVDRGVWNKRIHRLKTTVRDINAASSSVADQRDVAAFLGQKF